MRPVLDVLQLPGVLGADECAALCGLLGNEAAAPARVLDGAAGRYLPQVRRAARLDPPAAVQARVAGLLESLRPQFEAYFGQPLGEAEPAQFLRYAEGDFFVAHQDGNTPLLRDDSLLRRVSLVLFLNAQGAEGYGGGELVFHARPGQSPAQLSFAPPAGTVLAFRAETTHEVLPISHGLRFSVASWYRATAG